MFGFGNYFAPTQWGLLTVFGQIGQKWITQQINSEFLLVLSEEIQSTML